MKPGVICIFLMISCTQVEQPVDKVMLQWIPKILKSLPASFSRLQNPKYQYS